MIIRPLKLNDTHLNSYSVQSDPLEIGPAELTMDNPLDNPFDSSQPFCVWLLSGALAIPRLGLRLRLRQANDDGNDEDAEVIDGQGVF